MRDITFIHCVYTENDGTERNLTLYTLVYKNGTLSSKHTQWPYILCVQDISHGGTRLSRNGAVRGP